MARYPGERIVPFTKTIEGRHCQMIDVSQLGWIMKPYEARDAWKAAGVWYQQINLYEYWVDCPRRAQKVLNVALDPQGTQDQITFLQEDLPETVEEIEDLQDLYQKIHGGQEL